MKKYFVHSFIFGITSAVLISNYFPNLKNLIWLVLLIKVIFIFSLLFFYKTNSNWQQNKKTIILIIIFLSFLSLTLWRIDSLKYKPRIPDFSGKKIQLEGKISGEIDIQAFNSRLKINVSEIVLENAIIKTNENILAVTNHFPEYQTGDKVKLYGKIQLPENFENENGIEFDYINYLAKDNVYSNTYYPRIELIQRPNFNLNRSIFSLKNSFLGKVQKIMPSPESELLGGILLGTKRSLGKDLEEKFRIVGLIHIVVLSGYNITIIAEAIFRVLSFLPRVASASLGIFSIIIFSIMVGSGATVIRSTIMTILALVSRLSNKNYDVNRALFVSGALMIFHNPQILLHDPSFQLSFLATIGLINFSDFVKKFIKFIPEKFEIREITSATLSTQIAVLPLLAKMTGEISVVAPIVNILTLQIIPITMLLGFIAGVISFLSETVGLVLAYPPYLFLHYILVVVDYFSKFSFATFKLVS